MSGQKYRLTLSVSFRVAFGDSKLANDETRSKDFLRLFFCKKMVFSINIIFLVHVL